MTYHDIAVKHSSLSSLFDFGDLWYDVPCSQTYWTKVIPVFKYLEDCKSKGIKFEELNDKEENIYVPILNAFIDEVNSQAATHPEIPSKLVDYFLGKYDSYKVVGVDASKYTIIQTHNNNRTKKLPKAALPTRIAELEYKPGSKTTLDLYMDGGWQFSFSIHDADKFCEPILKLDMRIVGQPKQIILL